MKATVDVPDLLYRRVKARAAIEGRAVRDVTIELYERWLADEPSLVSGDRDAAATAWLARWERLGGLIQDNAADPRTTRQVLTDDRR